MTTPGKAALLLPLNRGTESHWLRAALSKSRKAHSFADYNAEIVFQFNNTAHLRMGGAQFDHSSFNFLQVILSVDKKHFSSVVFGPSEKAG